MSDKSDIAIVILNYNTLHYLEQFVPKVLEFSGDSKLIVVDNASTDGSREYLNAHKDQFDSILLDENFGYAGGYNRALAQINSEYYVLLNTDVEVSENWLLPLKRLMDDNANVAAVQPKIKAYNDIRLFEYAGASGGLMDKWGYPFCRGRIFDELEIDHGQYDTPMQIFWATGAAFMVRSEVFHQCGGFDERFFAHMEEIDLCWRMQHRGFEIYVEPGSEVFHVGGGTLANGSSFKYYLNYRNNLAMLTKNLSSKTWYLVLLWKMVLDGVSALNFLIGGRPSVLWQVLKAHMAYWSNLGLWIKERKKIDKGYDDSKLFQKSIVWEYFIKRNRKYSDLSI
ncbi:MAG: glycosyltransferase family 2 protein [Bacteroidia bacterium]